jgi:hypothetical protein
MKMKNVQIILCLLLTFTLSHSLFSQEQPITYQKTGLGTAFYQGSMQLKPKAMVGITEKVPEANAYMKKAKSNYDAAQVFGFVGAFGVGWALGGALGGGEFNTPIFLGGVGVMLVAIPFSSAYKKNAIKGADLYNGSKGLALESKPIWSLSANGNGIGVSLTF